MEFDFIQKGMIAICIFAISATLSYYLSRWVWTPRSGKKPDQTHDTEGQMEILRGHLEAALSENDDLREQIRRAEIANETLSVTYKKRDQEARHFENEFNKTRKILGKIDDLIQEFVKEDDNEYTIERPCSPHDPMTDSEMHSYLNEVIGLRMGGDGSAYCMACGVEVINLKEGWFQHHGNRTARTLNEIVNEHVCRPKPNPFFKNPTKREQLLQSLTATTVLFDTPQLGEPL